MADREIVKSVGRVFAVLELFEHNRKGLSATDVERALDYPKSSTLAVLKSMVALGYLSYDRIGKHYFPTIRVAQLGHWIDAADTRHDLYALVADAAEITGETVTIASQNDLHMQFLTVVTGSNPLMLNFRPGMTGPLFRSNMGMVALAQKSDAEIRRLAERMNRRAGSSGERVDDLVGTMERINQIRRDGYATGYGNYVESVGVISWPLASTGGASSLVISIGGPVEAIRTSEQRIVEQMVAILTDHGYPVGPTRAPGVRTNGGQPRPMRDNQNRPRPSRPAMKV